MSTILLNDTVGRHRLILIRGHCVGRGYPDAMALIAPVYHREVAEKLISTTLDWLPLYNFINCNLNNCLNKRNNMYIAHYVIKNDSKQHWKMFSDYIQAFDFMELQDTPIKIVRFDPTCPEPQVIWWGENTQGSKAQLQAADDKAVLKHRKMDMNEIELIYEDICEQISAFSLGLQEQVRRLFNT